MNEAYKHMSMAVNRKKFKNSIRSVIYGVFHFKLKELKVNTKRIFILGLGHKKCGTSWLHKYLCQSDKFAEGFEKEFHFWDSKDILLFAKNKIRPSAKQFISS